MANHRRMTPEALERAVEAYFDSISYETEVKRKKLVTAADEHGNDVPVLDKYGHEVYTYEPVVLKNGDPAMETVWIRPPSIIAMSLFIGVDRTTLFRWKNLSGKEKPTASEKRICNILTRAWGRVEAYLTEKTEDGKAGRGAVANLEANFQWKQRREVGLSQETTEVIKETAELTMGQKLELLMEMGLRMPGEEQEEKEEENDQ